MTAYARAVVAGKVVAGRLVRLACERHLRDLKDGHRRGLKWDTAAAAVAIDFFSLLKHSKGEWAGETFVLQPWQRFFVGSVFGWKRADGTRRFRTAHLEVGRKNGKTTVCSGIGLKQLLLDGEAGAEVYAIATKRDQAKLTHDESVRMVKASAALSDRVRVFNNNLNVPSTNSKFEPLGADADTLDGLNPSTYLADELHAWRNRLLWDVMETATGARRQPLGVITTTAGYDKHSLWWELRQRAVQMLEGTVGDDSLFALIYTPDEGDRWDDEATWPKSNPNLGVTVRADEMREQCLKAKQMPAAQNAFRRLRLNEPTEQADRWIDLDLWDANAAPVDEAGLAGLECYGGLDLSATTDLSALVWAFPPQAGCPLWRLVCRFWTPAETIQRRADRDGAAYGEWVRGGHLTATPGNVIDYDTIEARVLADCERFAVRKLCFDRYLANQLTVRLLDKGVPVAGFGQGFASMSAPTKELMGLLLERKVAHGGHPVLRWNAANVAVRQDPAGNLKPDKAESTGRIDGIVAAVMALGPAIAAPPADAPGISWI